MSEPDDDIDLRGLRGARTLGWVGLATWAMLGIALEAAHGLKLAGYLDDELTRLLLTLAHAHGVALSLLLVVFAHAGAPLLSKADAWTSRLLTGAAVALPLGFALSSIAHPESDPGIAILIVPIAGLALVIGLARVAFASWRSP
ncbi:MAG: hypothetical protein J0L92_34695 [Deltaproteobacteria bacterium]|nr:hypothetical protein [Deltaproteobacteria bacterium]